MDVRLEIRHLKLLASIADTGSVTEASKQLHLTQSALSHQLRDAEDKLGTALFLRLGKKMVLTPAGETLVVSARRVLDELGSAESRVEGLNGGARGIIRLSTECYTCYHWLPALLKKFHQKFSDVEVMVDASATSDPAAALLDGKLDVAIMNSPPRNKSLRQALMFEDELVLVMAPNHRLAAFPSVHPRQLAGETVLIYPPREESTLIQKIMIPAGVEPQRVIQLPLTEAILEMAAAGNGIGLLARWAVAPHVEAGRLVGLPLASRGFHRQWHAVTLKSQADTPYMVEFLNLLTTHHPRQMRRARA